MNFGYPTHGASRKRGVFVFIGCAHSCEILRYAQNDRIVGNWYTGWTMQKLHYGFLDESGVIEEQAHKGRHFIVSIIVVGNLSELKHVMKHARKKIRSAKGSYYASRKFKASKEAPALVRQVLKELSKCNIGMVVGLWDKSQYPDRDSSEHIRYAGIVARTVADALEHWPRLSLTVHKRYTLPAVQIGMNRIIENHALEYSQGESRFLTIDHRTEEECRELELADAVAWAVFQKYNQHDSSFYDIIKDKIKKENRLAA